MNYKIYYKNDRIQIYYKDDKCNVNMYTLPEDTITYSVNLQDNTIHARIANPSQHTLYLISQGRCYLWLDTKMTKKWSRYRGTYTYGPGTRTN